MGETGHLVTLEDHAKMNACDKTRAVGVCVCTHEQALFETMVLAADPLLEPQANSSGQELENVWSKVF